MAEAPRIWSLRSRSLLIPMKSPITFKDNGLGMTMEEVEEYINQIAFSGAQDFLEKI